MALRGGEHGRPDPAAADCAARRRARLERILLAVLCVATFAYAALQYQPFALPNNDYYSFERTALALAEGELPRDFKRMPILPALMALAAPWMPDPHPFLHAALRWNLVFSVGLLVALFALAERTPGTGAIVPVVLLASNLEFHVMGLQPLVEPSYGFFVVLAFALLAARSPWQYAAAGAAALSRYEAVLLLPVLALVNARFERRPLRHATLALAGASGFIAWSALGALRGSGEASYLSVMGGMDWRPEPRFVLHYFREAFAGFYTREPWLLPVFTACVGVPLAAGMRAGWRERRRETLALLGFWGLSAAAIVSFGVDKPRYAYPSEWIPLLFFAWGSLRLLEAGFRRLATRRDPLRDRVLVVAAAGALALTALFWTVRLVEAPDVAPFAADAAFVGLCLAVLAGFLAAHRRAPAGSWLAAAGLFLVVMTFEVAGGIRAKEVALADVRDANHASLVLARWLERHMTDDDRLVLEPRSHLVYLTGRPGGHFRVFAEFQAETPEALAEEMRRLGFTLVAYTHRPEVTSRHGAFMHRVKKMELAEQFRDGAEVPGFVRVATLPAPPELGIDPVQVYRLAR